MRKRGSWLWYAAVGLVGFLLVIASVVLWNFYAIRTPLRWFAGSHEYKARVLAEASTGELKHIEWDDWGWAGEDTTVYLVLDPTNSLSAAARDRQPGRFRGLPCKVFRVTQLEKNWYTVQFYTNEYWGRRNYLDCSAQVSSQ